MLKLIDQIILHASCSLPVSRCSVSFWETSTSTSWRQLTEFWDQSISFCTCSSSSSCCWTCSWLSSMILTPRSRLRLQNRRMNLTWEITSRRFAKNIEGQKFSGKSILFHKNITNMKAYWLWWLCLFYQGYNNMMNKLNFKRDKIVDIQKALRSADINQDKQLDFDEWRQDLKTWV